MLSCVPDRKRGEEVNEKKDNLPAAGSSRSPCELLASAHAVIDSAFSAGAEVMVPLLSGGHDSECAVYAASLHPKFDGNVYHIITGIGAAATFRHVTDWCNERGWSLRTYRSPETYEKFVRERGFPGPGRHGWIYNRIKERCVRQIMRERNGRNIALVTGCRSQESIVRMGTVEPLKIGERSRKQSKFLRNLLLFAWKEQLQNRRRYWVAPCHDWSREEQASFMDYYDLPLNPIKMSPIGMSGECFCGAFARPDEIAMIRKYAPDVAEEIDRLAAIAKANGKHCVWGTRPDNKKGVVLAETGPLCSSCDARAMVAGFSLAQGTLASVPPQAETDVCGAPQGEGE